jgi:hypothetical protein
LEIFNAWILKEKDQRKYQNLSQIQSTFLWISKEILTVIWQWMLRNVRLSVLGASTNKCLRACRGLSRDRFTFDFYVMFLLPSPLVAESYLFSSNAGYYFIIDPNWPQGFNYQTVMNNVKRFLINYPSYR